MRAHVLAVTAMAATPLATHGGVVAPAEAQDAVEYRVLATSKTSTMEQEINEAADAGFRVDTLMGGQTAFGGEELVVIMSRRSDASEDRRYDYTLLATNRTSTMRSEIRRAGEAGYEYVGQTTFQSMFGSTEVVVVLERTRDAEPRPREYQLLSTSRTSTMQRELQEASADGYGVIGMTVGQTTFGAWEIITILEREGTP